MTSKPNVILITSDQQRFDSVGLNGSTFMHTPNMDAIGKQGASFQRAYCPSTVCTPSRVSIMSGQHLSRHGAYNIGTWTTDDSVFLSTILRAHGYRTHHVGKAHWHPYWANSPENQEVDQQGTAFHDFAGFSTAEVCIGHSTFGLTGHYKRWLEQKGFDLGSLHIRQLFQDDSDEERDAGVVRTSPPRPSSADPNETGDWNLPVELHQGQWLVERAIDFLEKQDGNEPFYLNLGFQDPHHPHVLPQEFKRRVDPMDIPLPDINIDAETNHADHIPLLHEGKLVDSRFNGWFVMAGNVKDAWRPYFENEQKARMTRAYYYSMVQLMDDQLGVLLNALDRLGLRDNTILVFTSDHGEMLGDHCIGQKGPMIYEGVTHVPLMMRYPQGFDPCEIKECVSLVDLLPTILDFVGIEDSIKRDGISLKRRLQQGEALPRNGVRIEYKEEPDKIRFKCWVTDEWKLAIYFGETFGELYDLKNDPDEKHNLFADPAFAQVKAELMIDMLHDLERSEPVSVRPCRA